MVNFSNIIFYVKDVHGAVSFFTTVFGLEIKFMAEQYAEINTGSTVLAFASESLASSNLPGGFLQNDIHQAPQASEIVFTVSDVQKYYEKALSAGALNIASPSLKPWGQTVAYIRTPQGILVDIASTIQ